LRPSGRTLTPRPGASEPRQDDGARNEGGYSNPSLDELIKQIQVEQLFASPRQPYTRLLLETILSIEVTGREREPVAGEVPNPINPPPGGSFHPRCPFANVRCRRERPELINAGGTLVARHAVKRDGRSRR
jgi:oligopeptide/dipeptide ABC transporter ATP-binding protein